jgi:hypothetical protein
MRHDLCKTLLHRSINFKPKTEFGHTTCVSKASLVGFVDWRNTGGGGRPGATRDTPFRPVRNGARANHRVYAEIRAFHVKPPPGTKPAPPPSSKYRPHLPNPPELLESENVHALTRCPGPWYVEQRVTNRFWFTN